MISMSEPETVRAIVKKYSVCFLHPEIRLPKSSIHAIRAKKHAIRAKKRSI